MQHLDTFLFVLLSTLAALLALSRISHVPYPILLVTGGALLGFVPGMPRVELSSDVVLLVFLPPLLFYGAFVYQTRQFKENVPSISVLAIGLVIATTIGVAAVAHVTAGLPWGVALILGAAVSPTDPVAITAIASRLGLPRRVTAVLEGESLINDGSALVVYATAVEAVVSGQFPLTAALIEFPVTVLGGIAIGLVVAWFISWALLRRLGSGYHIIVLVLLCAYLTYLTAELLGVSGVLAAVSGGIYIGYRAPLDVSPTDRITAYSFLEIMVFLANAFLFILMGLQFPGIMTRIAELSPYTLVLLALGLSITVLGLRVGWAMIFGQVIFRLIPKQRARYAKPPWRESLVIGWAGMRGAVALAAALAIPTEIADGTPLVQRDLILFLVSAIIFVTLVLPGLTLPALLRRLALSSDHDEVHEEVRLARTVGARAGLDRLERLRTEPWLPEDTAEVLRELYAQRYRGLAGKAADDPETSHEERYSALRRLRHELLLTEREALLRLHQSGEISDEAMRQVERDLDLQQSRFES